MKGAHRRNSIAAVALILLGLAAWAVLLEPGCVTVRPSEITLEEWPPSLAGLRVAALGDIHTGAPHVSPAKLSTIVADVLGGLRAPGGVIAVLGNHDWWYDGPRVRTALERSGIVVLENSARRVVHGDGAFWIAGLADLWTREPDLTKALAAVPAGEPVLLLTHSPDVFPDVPVRVALTLAAHTHGGQVRFPPFPAPVVPSMYGSRYAAGHIVEEGRHLFVTTGVGTSILPVRFAVPPEVALLTLR